MVSRAAPADVTWHEGGLAQEVALEVWEVEHSARAPLMLSAATSCSCRHLRAWEGTDAAVRRGGAGAVVVSRARALAVGGSVRAGGRAFQYASWRLLSVLCGLALHVG